MPDRSATGQVAHFRPLPGRQPGDDTTVDYVTLSQGD